MVRISPQSPLFPYTTLFRSRSPTGGAWMGNGSRDRESREFTLAATSARAPDSRILPASSRETESHRVLTTDISWVMTTRSEEHTSELQSRGHLVCRLLLENK